MRPRWFVWVLVFLLFSIAGCESTKQTVKNADEWVEKNMW